MEDYVDKFKLDQIEDAYINQEFVLVCPKCSYKIIFDNQRFLNVDIFKCPICCQQINIEI